VRRKILSATTIAASIAVLLAIGGGHAFADDLQRLSGAQIRATLAGKQFTDEVHWRDVYERDGSFRGYSMGRKSNGKWSIRGDELGLDLPAPDDGCYAVAASGRRVVMTPQGNGLVVEGIIEPISNAK